MFIQHMANLEKVAEACRDNHSLWFMALQKGVTQCNSRAIFKSFCKGNVPCGNSTSENVHLDLIFPFLLTFAEKFFFLISFFKV